MHTSVRSLQALEARYSTQEQEQTYLQHAVDLKNEWDSEISRAWQQIRSGAIVIGHDEY